MDCFISFKIENSAEFMIGNIHWPSQRVGMRTLGSFISIFGFLFVIDLTQ